MIDGDASVGDDAARRGEYIAKLTTGEIAQGDRWFGGETKSPWDHARLSVDRRQAGIGDSGWIGRLLYRHRTRRIDSRTVGAVWRHRAASHARTSAATA